MIPRLLPVVMWHARMTIHKCLDGCFLKTINADYCLKNLLVSAKKPDTKNKISLPLLGVMNVLQRRAELGEAVRAGGRVDFHVLLYDATAGCSITSYGTSRARG